MLQFSRALSRINQIGGDPDEQHQYESINGPVTGSECYPVFLLKMIIALGNGAEFSQSSNFSRPFMKRISVAFIQNSCHQRVSVRLGIKNTTVFPFFHSSNPLAIHFGSSRPYGGFT